MSYPWLPLAPSGRARRRVEKTSVAASPRIAGHRVKVASRRIDDHDCGQTSQLEPENRFGSEILEGDDRRSLNGLAEQCAETANRREVDRAVLDKVRDCRLGEIPFADSPVITIRP
jgi:hypothetical protein